MKRIEEPNSSTGKKNAGGKVNKVGATPVTATAGYQLARAGSSVRTVIIKEGSEPGIVAHEDIVL